MKKKKLNDKEFTKFVKEIVDYSNDKLYCIIDANTFDFTEEQILVMLEMNSIFKRKRKNYRIMVNPKKGIPEFDVKAYNVEDHVERINDITLAPKGERIQHGTPIEIYYKELYQKYKLLLQ